MTKIIEFFKGLFSGWNNPPPPTPHRRKGTDWTIQW